MSANERSFFLKFKLDEDGRTGGFKIAFAKDRIAEWDNKQNEGEAKESKDKLITPDSESAPFPKLIEEFYNQNSMFNVSMPTLLSVLPVYERIYVDKNLRRFAKKARHSVGKRR